jgi:hypothetical protein
MFQKENWIILCINTIIIVVVLFVLFRQQDTKLRSYIRRIEKKMSCQKPQSHINSEQNNLLQNNITYPPLNKNEETGSTQLMVQPSDIDSFYDPMQN